MTRQCVGCGIALPDGGRSPRCLGCWTGHQKERNRAKVRAHRQRALNALNRLDATNRPHLPSETDLGWLDRMDAELGGTIRRVVEMRKGGRPPDDSYVLRLASEALHRFASIRGAIEDRARTREDGASQFTNWDGFFESVRKAVG